MARGSDPDSDREQIKRRLAEKLKELEEDPQTAAENRTPLTTAQNAPTVRPPPENAVQTEQMRPPTPEIEIEWEYVDDDHDEMLLCGVCFTLLKDPQLLTCCGDQLICKECLVKAHERNKVLRQQSICPFCRSEDFKMIPNADIRKLVDNLKVWCPQKNNGCKWVGTIQEGKQHLTICPYTAIRCPRNCSMGKFQRHHLSDHNAVCPAEPVFCLFRQMCCKELILRCNMKMHAKSSMNDHLLALAKANTEVAEECQAIIQSLNAGSERMLREKSKKVATLRKIHSQKQATLVSLMSKLQHSKKKRSSLLEENAQISTQHTHEVKSQSNGAFRLRKLALGLQAHLESLHAPVVEGYIPIPVTFTLDKFSERKANDDSWMSPPFYTHLGGYKMCLIVNLNGKGTHVSIYLHMLKGENDDLLVWPFPGAVVTVLILNQRNTLTNMVMKSHGHARQCFNIQGKLWANVCKRVTDVTYGPGRGNSEFISHSQVGRYITDDTLKVKVHQIDFLPF